MMTITTYDISDPTGEYFNRLEVKALRSAAIGYFRSGATAAQISEITGFTTDAVEAVVTAYLKQTNSPECKTHTLLSTLKLPASIQGKTA